MHVPKEVKKRHFQTVLEELVREVMEQESYRNRGEAADHLGIAHPRLIRLLNGKNVAGARTVAMICSNLQRREASRLLEAYLLDEIETVTSLVLDKGGKGWGKDSLVVVGRK